MSLYFEIINDKYLSNSIRPFLECWLCLDVFVTWQFLSFWRWCNRAVHFKSWRWCYSSDAGFHFQELEMVWHCRRRLEESIRKFFWNDQSSRTGSWKFSYKQDKVRVLEPELSNYKALVNWFLHKNIQNGWNHGKKVVCFGIVYCDLVVSANSRAPFTVLLKGVNLSVWLLKYLWFWFLNII